VLSGSPLFDDLGETTSETRYHVLAVESVVRTELPNLGQRPVDSRGAPLGIDHPDERHARLEILADLVQDSARTVVRRQHLNGQIGGEVGESFRDGTCSPEKRPFDTKLTSGTRTLPPGSRKPVLDSNT